MAGERSDHPPVSNENEEQQEEIMFGWFSSNQRTRLFNATAQKMDAYGLALDTAVVCRNSVYFLARSLY